MHCEPNVCVVPPVNDQQQEEINQSFVPSLCLLTVKQVTCSSMFQLDQGRTHSHCEIPVFPLNSPELRHTRRSRFVCQLMRVRNQVFSQQQVLKQPELEYIHQNWLWGV